MNDSMLSSQPGINESFAYRSGDELGTYLYVGDYATYLAGGYVYEFHHSLAQISADLAELHRLDWIDKQTRAVIIQLNLYNPSVPTFTSVVILAELLPSSGVFPSARFEPLDFDGRPSID